MKIKLIIIFLPLFNLYIAKGQDISVNAFVLKDTIISIEPIKITYKVTNNSQKKYIFSSNVISPCYKPMLECRESNTSMWITVENSFDQNKTEYYMVCGEADYQSSIELSKVNIFDETVSYSVFSFKRQNGYIDYKTIKPIFQPEKHYDIRLKILNPIGNNIIDTLYSNVLKIHTFRERWKDKKAKKWLLNQNSFSSIFEPLLNDPILEVSKKEMILNFIRLYPSSIFIDYAEVSLANMLIKEELIDNKKGLKINPERYREINRLIEKGVRLKSKDKRIFQYYEQKSLLIRISSNVNDR